MFSSTRVSSSIDSSRVARWGFNWKDEDKGGFY